MQKLELNRWRAMLAAALLLSACETASIAPEPRTAPAPATLAADYEALLQAMQPGQPGQPVDRRQVETVRVLAETLARMEADAESGTGAASLSPSAECALREFAASPDGQAAMQRVLDRMAGEPDPRKTQP